MRYRQIILILLGMVAGSPLLAQEGSEDLQVYCTIEPVFHCAEPMDDGGYIGHFGYRTSCPESDKPVKDVFVDIGDDNYFTPGPIDRGQPKIFLPGEHVDEFEVEFSALEIREGKEFGWIVRKIAIPVDITKTKDASLDCTSLSY